MTSVFLILYLFALGHGHVALAQTSPTGSNPAVTDVRQMVTEARKEIERYKTAGGATAAPDHPALKWDAALWAYRERAQDADARAIATVEAIRFLSSAELWDRAHARIESLDADDASWTRVASAIYSEGVARKDLAYTIEKLSKTANSTTSPAIKAAALVILGRAYRRQGDNAAATRSLEAARSAAPGTPAAIEADGLIYEIEHLSIGMSAPSIVGKARNGRAVDLAAFRGKPVVLVFWAST